MGSLSKSHVRNVAGQKLIRVTRAVYEQPLGNDKKRWFIRFHVDGTKSDYVWKFTRPFVKKPNTVGKTHYRTLTDAVIAANKKK